MLNFDKKEDKIVNDQPFKNRILNFIYKESAEKEEELEELRELLKSTIFNHLNHEADEAWLCGYLAACVQITKEIEK